MMIVMMVEIIIHWIASQIMKSFVVVLITWESEDDGDEVEDVRYS